VKSEGDERRGYRSSVLVFPLLRSLNRGNDDNDDAIVAATGVNHDFSEF